MTAVRRGGWVGTALILLVAGCTVPGTASIAPYRSRAIDTVSAQAVLAGPAHVLALAPNGTTLAIADPTRGVCLVPATRVPTTPPAGQCADIGRKNLTQLSALFSPDGRTLAVASGQVNHGQGPVVLLDVPTGRTTAVPGPAGAVSGKSAAPQSNSDYAAMIWSPTDGHLMLMDSSITAAGAMTRLVDIDPQSLIPRVVVQATGAYEFLSGDLALGGPSVVFTVYRGDQVQPNVIVVNRDTGVRKEFGPTVAGGTRAVPLAVSPDGTRAVIGAATSGPPGPPRLLDLQSGIVADIPGVAGDFAAAAYSPNGAQIALLCTVGATSTLTLASTGKEPPRVVGSTTAAPFRGTRLSWSGSDALSLSGTAPLATGALAGWTLTGS